jgi:hypothetical protein
LENVDGKTSAKLLSQLNFVNNFSGNFIAWERCLIMYEGVRAGTLELEI